MTRWLDASQQVDWRAFYSVLTLLPDQLSRDLQEKHGLTLQDYEILVRLSEAPERSLRMSELAEYTLSSRSRLTHQIDRMVRDGLVERNACSNDKRGFFATMTEAGWQKLVAAAPDHVESVRQHLVDVLSPQQFAALGTISLSVLESLDPALQEKVVRSVQ